MARVIKFYKDGEVYYFGSSVVPEASLTIGQRDDGTVIIRDLKSNLKFAGPISDIHKKSGGAYASFAALVTALDGFFKQNKANILEELGTDPVSGGPSKVLSEKGTFVDLPVLEETPVE